MGARCGGRGEAGVASSSIRDCNKREGGRGGAGAASLLMSDCNKMGRVGMWNVRSFRITGKLTNVLSELDRVVVEIMGVAETCWDK